MFKLLKNSKGQGAAVQYALTFFFVVAVVVSMTVYFKRAIQGRIKDATLYMAETVHDVYQGNMYIQYEPYYMETVARRAVDADRSTKLLASFNASSGIYDETDSTTSIGTIASNQLPPALAK